MRQGGVEVFGEERVEVCGEKEGGVADAEGDGAGDVVGGGDVGIRYGEELGEALVAFAGVAGEGEGLGSTTEGGGLVEADGQARREEG